jgi:hypothetical protein
MKFENLNQKNRYTYRLCKMFSYNTQMENSKLNQILKMPMLINGRNLDLILKGSLIINKKEA